MRETPSILVVEDDSAVLRSVLRLLNTHGFEAKGYSSPQSLLNEIEMLSPDCVIADVAMPELSGLDLQQMLAEFRVDYPMVFITGHGDIRSSVTAMRAGAVDFLTKPFDQHGLLDAVRRGVERSRSAREVSNRLEELRRRAASLTQRERDVFELVVGGYLNKQIASTLGISEKTVKVHRARVMRKMLVRSVAQLARVAEQIGTPLTQRHRI